MCLCLRLLLCNCNFFAKKKKKFSRPLYKKKFSSLPQPPLPPLAMLAAKRQDGGLFKSPPYPGYPFIMIPDLTSPYLPNGSLSPTARTVSSFIYSLYVHTHSSHTHTLTPRVRRRGKGRRGVLSPWSAADKNAEPSFANSPWSVQYNGMHACMRARTRLPARLPWSEASMLTVLKSCKWVKIKGKTEISRLLLYVSFTCTAFLPIFLATFKSNAQAPVKILFSLL